MSTFLHLVNEEGQRESSRRLFLIGSLAAYFYAAPALGQDKLDPGGLTFRDFSTNDNGASFSRGDPMIAGGPNQVSSKIAAIESDTASAVHTMKRPVGMSKAPEASGKYGLLIRSISISVS